MALLCDAAISLLHQVGVKQIASRFRRHSQRPKQAVAPILNPLPTGA
jgi:hypothetical protein